MVRTSVNSSNHSTNMTLFRKTGEKPKYNFRDVAALPVLAGVQVNFFTVVLLVVVHVLLVLHLLNA